MLIFAVVGGCAAVFTYRRRKKAAQRGRTILDTLARARLGEGPWEASLRLRAVDAGGRERMGWASVLWFQDGTGLHSLLRAADDGPVLVTRHAGAGADLHWVLQGSGPVTWFPGVDGLEPGIFSEMLSYEDLTAVIRGEPTHRLVAAKGEDAVRYHVLDRVPAGKRARYKKARMWVDRERGRVERVEFYDHKNRCVLRKRVSEWEALEGGAHLPRKFEAEDPRDGRRIEVVFEGYSRPDPARELGYEGLVPLPRGVYATPARAARPIGAAV